MSIEHVFFEHVAACPTVSKYNQEDRRKGMNKNPHSPAATFLNFIYSITLRQCSVIGVSAYQYFLYIPELPDKANVLKSNWTTSQMVRKL